jgi:hypothetical protein
VGRRLSGVLRMIESRRTPDQAGSTPPPDQRGVSGRRLLTAELAYDTQAQHLPRGVRTLRSRERRLLFDAGEYEVMLQVVRDVAAGSFRITGLVLADGNPVMGASVVLAGEASVRTDQAGVFKAVHADAASCHLRLEADDWELTLPSFDLISAALGSL